MPDYDTDFIFMYCSNGIASLVILTSTIPWIDSKQNKWTTLASTATLTMTTTVIKPVFQRITTTGKMEWKLRLNEAWWNNFDHKLSLCTWTVASYTVTIHHPFCSRSQNTVIIFLIKSKRKYEDYVTEAKVCKRKRKISYPNREQEGKIETGDKEKLVDVCNHLRMHLSI